MLNLHDRLSIRRCVELFRSHEFLCLHWVELRNCPEEGMPMSLRYGSGEADEQMEKRRNRKNGFCEGCLLLGIVLLCTVTE
ncbi:hypothetical protein QQG55_38260 [Brugia pahangi]